MFESNRNNDLSDMPKIISAIISGNEADCITKIKIEETDNEHMTNENTKPLADSEQSISDSKEPMAVDDDDDDVTMTDVEYSLIFHVWNRKKFVPLKHQRLYRRVTTTSTKSHKLKKGDGNKLERYETNVVSA